MAITKVTKRSLEQANLADSNENKKPFKQLKKVNSGKQGAVQNNGVTLKTGNKPKKFEKKTEVKNTVKKEVKKEGAATPATGNVSNESQKNPKKAAKLLKKKENRKVARKEQGQYKPENMNLSIDSIKSRIAELEQRPELSKTARRRLRLLKIKLRVADGTHDPKIALAKKGGESAAAEKRKERKQKRLEMLQKRKQAKGGAETDETKPKVQSIKKEGGDKQKNKQIIKTEGKKPVVAGGQGVKPVKGAGKKEQLLKGKQAKKIVKAEPEDSEEDDEEDDEAEDSNVSLNTTEEQSDDEDVDDDEEDEDEDESLDEDEEEDEDAEDDNEDEEDEEEEEEEETKPVVPVKKAKQESGKVQAPKKEVKKEQAANGDTGKKKRYVVFVGNLPFTATADDIKKHFLTKVSEVSSVRVPSKPGSNVSRGFAYVEFTNSTDYEKGLSLHNTMLNNRKLNVQYTKDGAKAGGNNSDVTAKNKKLHALRAQGKLAGSQKDGHKRSDRRQKQKQQRPS